MKLKCDRLILKDIQVKSGTTPAYKYINGKKELDPSRPNKSWKLQSFKVDLGKGMGTIRGVYWGQENLTEELANIEFELKNVKYVNAMGQNTYRHEIELLTFNITENFDDIDWVK